ncbi:Aste57867_23572 [Aphanomyces stellatus]|uniref:Aste57867_23572 protein n=1 Tax=Aphanomyces stellatus TaxID=120398 RepID=A0A485LN91_9STRA|nr:hypothetical protein As57867_023501 [Aphanomyces stellatus]VFU00217.1 Aste57867_23572 [Aphanomyces stellatus]
MQPLFRLSLVLVVALVLLNDVKAQQYPIPCMKPVPGQIYYTIGAGMIDPPPICSRHLPDTATEVGATCPVGPPQRTQFSVSHELALNYSSHRYPNDCRPLLSGFAAYIDAACTQVVRESPRPTHHKAFESKNGFILSVVRAYNERHNLVFRPDDIWLAILIQFSLYVTGSHTESSGSTVVKRPKKLTLETMMPLHAVTSAALAKQLFGQLQAHLVDPSLSDWIVPDFSTTTDHDRIIGTVALMASLITSPSDNLRAFGSLVRQSCGIPEVTLLGSVHDWERLRARIHGFLPFGSQMAMWVDLLGPILDQFVAAAQGQVDRTFWRQICYFQYDGSTRKSQPLRHGLLSGWHTVFAVFHQDGSWQGSDRRMRAMHSKDMDENQPRKGDEQDLSEYPVLPGNVVAPGYITVDVAIKEINGVEYDALLFAGHTSIDVVSSDTIAPHLMWALALKGQR